jgi:hypothetical protein
VLDVETSIKNDLYLLPLSPFQVSDFGLARPTESNQEGGKFPIKWTAPEALQHNVRLKNVMLCVTRPTLGNTPTLPKKSFYF